MGNAESTQTSKNVPMPQDVNECPVKAKSQQAEECPVKYKNPNVYNVYSQKINPTNQMPDQPMQTAAPSQSQDLSVDRVSSNIPKGGTDADTWTYPSPQMFWNALVRKGKMEGASENDMDTVVSIHNNMNENTWRQVMAWEGLHLVKGPGREPKLLRFMGKPDDLSPKAYLKTLFGHPAPFDRHDWIVDRGGEEVRYVIDYYHDESKVTHDTVPKQLRDAHAMQSIVVDVRPALDSVGSVVSRLMLMPWAQMRGITHYNPPPFLPPRQMKSAEEARLEELNEMWRSIRMKCEGQKVRLGQCQTDEECGQAATALQLCSASVICPSVARDFQKFLEDEKNITEEKFSVAYKPVANCLELFEIECSHRK